MWLPDASRGRSAGKGVSWSVDNRRILDRLVGLFASAAGVAQIGEMVQ
jgi:hypothetical protein